MKILLKIILCSQSLIIIQQIEIATLEVRSENVNHNQEGHVINFYSETEIEILYSKFSIMLLKYIEDIYQILEEFYKDYIINSNVKNKLTYSLKITFNHVYKMWVYKQELIYDKQLIYKLDNYMRILSTLYLQMVIQSHFEAKNKKFSTYYLSVYTEKERKNRIHFLISQFNIKFIDKLKKNETETNETEKNELKFVICYRKFVRSVFNFLDNCVSIEGYDSILDKKVVFFSAFCYKVKSMIIAIKQLYEYNRLFDVEKTPFSLKVNSDFIKAEIKSLFSINEKSSLEPIYMDNLCEYINSCFITAIELKDILNKYSTEKQNDYIIKYIKNNAYNHTSNIILKQNKFVFQRNDSHYIFEIKKFFLAKRVGLAVLEMEYLKKEEKYKENILEFQINKQKKLDRTMDTEGSEKQSRQSETMIKQSKQNEFIIKDHEKEMDTEILKNLQDKHAKTKENYTKMKNEIYNTFIYGFTIYCNKDSHKLLQNNCDKDLNEKEEEIKNIIHYLFLYYEKTQFIVKNKIDLKTKRKEIINQLNLIIFHILTEE